MTGTTRLGLDHNTLLAYQKQYHTQKRLTDALFTLFRTLGSALQVEHVVNVALLTLTGQLLIKCAGLLQRDGNTYRLVGTVGARDSRLIDLSVSADVAAIASVFQQRGVIDLDAVAAQDPTLAQLRAHGFRGLFPLVDGAEPLGVIILGDKIVPGPLAPEDLQILDAFGVVIAVSLKNSVAYQLVESSRNELERLNEMKGEFLSHVSHEFRTPLTIFKNIFEMIEVEPEIAAMQRSALARLEHLVNSILLLNEINASGMKLEPQLLDAPAWIAELVRPILKRHGRFEIVSELPACKLEFDSFKVGIAIESLASNAVKFAGETAPPELRLYLSTRAHVVARLRDPRRDVTDLSPGWLRCTPPTEPDDPEFMLVMEVKDTGIGIPRSEVDTVFQPFTQAVNSPTRGVRGAGLGLAMAKRIADAHNGEIFVRSALGQGTILTIAIPAAPSRGA